MTLTADNGTTTVTPLTWGQTLTGLAIVAVTVLVAGLIVLWMRNNMSSKKPDDTSVSLIRSWLAIALVVGLLLFTVFSFHLGDASLSNTLVGATATSAGSVVAFYFASKAADQARQDILGSISSTVLVPDLTGQSKAAATTNLQHVRLVLAESPGGDTSEKATVKSQSPAANARVNSGSTVEVTLAAPAAESSGG